MSQSYHTYTEKQDIFLNIFSFYGGFKNQKPQTVIIKRPKRRIEDAFVYYDALSKCQRRIFRLLFLGVDWKKKSLRQFSNYLLAENAGCTVRTVRSAISKFVLDGWCYRWQKRLDESNTFECYMSERERFEFASRFMSEVDLDFIVENGVGRKKFKESKISSLYIDTSFSFYKEASASNNHRQASGLKFNICVRGKDADGFRKMGNKRMYNFDDSDPFGGKKLAVQKFELRDYSNKHLKIAELFDLNEQERVWLLAFPEIVIEDTYAYLKKYIDSGMYKKKPIDNCMAFILAKAKGLCVDKKLTPSWSIVYKTLEYKGFNKSSLYSKRPYKDNKNNTDYRNVIANIQKNKKIKSDNFPAITYDYSSEGWDVIPEVVVSEKLVPLWLQESNKKMIARRIGIS